MARVGAAVAVVDRVVEAGRRRAAEVRGGGERDGARDQATVPPVAFAHAGHGEGVALGVGVVGGEARPRAMTTSASSVPEALSSVATGASSTQVTLTVACAGSEPPWPSPTV